MAQLTKQQLTYLMEQAEKFNDDADVIPIPYIYRNKPSSQKGIENGIMVKYIKDNNGDPRSPINGKIHGLFFFATGDKSPPYYPPEQSSYGDYRIMIKPEHLLRGKNIYFADFYCLPPPHHRHYVTLVVTTPGSPEDKFCQMNILPLHANSKFLFRDEIGKYYTTRHPLVRVEVFYTESINIEEMKLHGEVKESYCEIRGRGSSTPGGLPKNPECKTCKVI